MSTLNSTECNSSNNEGLRSESYPCNHNDEDGKICIGNQSLAFHKNNAVEGNPLVNINLQDIESIESIESDGIHIATSLGDIYVFREIKNHNAVVKLVTMAKDEVSSGSNSEKNADESSQQEEKKCDEDVPTKDIIFFNSIQKNRKPDNLKETWLNLKKKSNPILKSDLIEDTILPCTLEHFHKMFWSTNAKYPISSYQYKVIGDTEIDTSQWEPSSDQFTLKRIIKYLHPNHAPMGPPKARTTKEQELQKYGEYGMMLHTVTKVDDVPMTDCFVIEDCIFVEPKDGAVMLTAKCGIRFEKKTVWKKLLESNAKKGIRKWWAGYRDFMIDTLNNE